MEKKNELLKALPKVDDSIGLVKACLVEDIPLFLIKKCVRETIDNERARILSGEAVSEKTELQWKETFLNNLARRSRHNLRRVLNGSGVVIHTNLGRSLLASDAITQMLLCSSGYSNLEFDLLEGKRGSRYALVEQIICDLTGAEAALVVNNNAAAVLLVLDTLAKGKETLVSRGELVEIGGSFRIPEVMEKSGALLVEVGATNRTHLADYENAISEETALLLKVHTSNFRIVGFTKEVTTTELVRLAGQKGLKVMEDLGSGCLLDMSCYGLPKERTVQEVVSSGADVVTFSGDKLLGGPQAGIIVGKKDVIERIKRNPLNRALRIDKLTLASLESTLRIYYEPHKALQSIPSLRMLAEDSAVTKRRARRLLRKIVGKDDLRCEISLVRTVSQTGGGAMPEYGLDSWAVKVVPKEVSLNRFEADMRGGDIPLIGRIENDAFLIDFRTILDGDIEDLAIILTQYFSSK